MWLQINTFYLFWSWEPAILYTSLLQMEIIEEETECMLFIFGGYLFLHILFRVWIDEEFLKFNKNIIIHESFHSYYSTSLHQSFKLYVSNERFLFLHQFHVFGMRTPFWKQILLCALNNWKTNKVG